MKAKRKNRQRKLKQQRKRRARFGGMKCERLEDRRLLDGDGLTPPFIDVIVDEANPYPFEGDAVPAEVTGFKWEDLNGNGLRDEGEPGLGGVTVYSDTNFNGQFDPDEPHTVTDLGLTDGEVGRYRLEFLRPGLHVIREVVPEGFQQTFPNFNFPEPFGPVITESGEFFIIPPLGDGAGHVLFLEPGQSEEGVDFGNVEIEVGTVTGRKWEDLNQNGEQDPDEPGLGSVTIYADLNYNGRLDRNEPTTETSLDDPNTDADEAGFYKLDNLQVGYHMIREVVPEGFEQTFPSLPDGHRPPPWGDASAHVVFVAVDAVVENVDFGNYRLPPGSVHGTKWEDVNGNGERDADEPGLAGVVIYSDVNQNGVFDEDEPHTRTMEDDPNTDFDEAGMYWLEGLAPGYHWIREVVPEGFEQTFPFSPFFLADDVLWPEGGGFDAEGNPIIGIPIPWPGNGAHDVLVEPGKAIEGIDFGNRKIEPGSVHGTKWHDVNGNGRREDDEPGLPGVTIYVDVNFNGELDEDEPRTKTMEDDPNTDFDEAGMYWLEGLRPGGHLIREVVPEGFRQTFPNVLHPFPIDPIPFPPIEPPFFEPGGQPGDILSWSDVIFPFHPGSHWVWLESGQVVEGLDFGNQSREPGSVHGTKWEDLNGDGERQENEPGLAGVVIYSDVNQNGVFDEDEPHTRTMEDDPNTDFDEAGMYWLEGLAPGYHWIREVVPEGFQQTYPFGPILFGHDGGPDELTIGIPFPWPNNAAHDVLVLPGQAIEGVDFGNQKIEPGSVHGTKWHDRNGNGQRDPDEPGLPGVVIYADLNFNGTLDEGEPSTRTMQDDPNTDFDEAGMYWLEGLRPGQVIVREVVPDGFRQTFPLSFPFPVEPIPFPDDILLPPDIFAPDGSHWVWLGSGETIEGLDFGNQSLEPGSIHGVKWLDRNGNGRRDPLEPGLPGVVIYVDANNNGRFDRGELSAETMEDDPTTFTDEGGRYWLEGVPAGTHIVREVLPEGYEQTFPLPPDGSLDPDGQDPATGEDGLSIADEFATAHPERLDLELEPGEIFITEVAVTVHPNIFRPLLIDVFASNPDIEFVNHTGPLVNGGGGDTSVFEVMIINHGEQAAFDIEFVDIEFGESLVAILPVTINGRTPPRTPGHRVTVLPGDEVDGINFGNRPLPRPEASIHGRKWEDLNGDGERQNDEPGLPGVVIYSDLNFNGVLDEGEPRTRTMEDDPDTDFDEAGLYRLEGLRPGEHVIAEIVPDGFVQTFPNFPVPAIFPPPPHAGRAHDVFLEPGDSIDGIDFGNQRTEPAVVAGRKWLDRNGNSRRDDNEPGLAGVTIYADLNFNGRFDFGEPSAVTAEDNPETRFDEGGLYEFRTRPVIQSIREIVPDGHVQTFPISDAASPWEQGAHFISPESGQVIDGLDFGNQPRDIFPSSVSGRKWLDRNGNGEREPNEPGLGGVTIYSDLNNNGQLDNNEPWTITQDDIPETDFDEAGLYHLEVPPLGNWIREVVPDGFHQTFPVSIAASPLETGAHFVLLEPNGHEDGLDFGNQPLDQFPAFVQGRVWIDDNGNGERDRNETGHAGVTVYSDLNSNGRHDADEPFAITTEDIPETDFDEGGLYHFETPSGFNWIRQVVPFGFGQTFPDNTAAFPGDYLLNLAPGESVDGLDFGNQPLPTVGEPMAADINNNGVIDGHDLLAMQRGYSESETASLHSDGDADRDGDVDGTDVQIWEDTFGFVLPRSESNVAAEALSTSASAVDAAIVSKLSEQLDGWTAPTQRGDFAAAPQPRPEYVPASRGGALSPAIDGSLGSSDAWEVEIATDAEGETTDEALDEAFAELV